MLEIKMTVNGKPYSEDTLQNEIENAIIKSVIANITDQIHSALSAAETAQITLNFKGTIGEDFGVEIDGPDDLVAKAAAALNQED